jgi:MerR family transcriptional regulator, thiopeptide resistance regulator
VDRHREQIDRWFYPCSIEMQVNLGEMYVADPRFAATYERVKPGLATFLRDAIRGRAGLPDA